MPPAAARWRIGIIDADRETLGAAWRPAPAQAWRDVVTGAAKALEHLLIGDAASLFDFGACKAHALRIGGSDSQQGQNQNRKPGHLFPHGQFLLVFLLALQADKLSCE